jgi:hypothetical protein
MSINHLYALGVLAALSIAGCAPTWYDIMENGRVAACEPLHGQERADCLAQAKKSWDAYEQERREVLGKDK